MQIIDRLIEKIGDKRGMVSIISKDTGIPSGRIYKWIEGKGNPKVTDSNLLQKWMDDLEKVPFTTDEPPSSEMNEPDLIITRELPGEPGNYQLLIFELKEQNKLLKTQNELLKTSLNLDAALKKLKDTEEALRASREQSSSHDGKSKVEFGETESDSEEGIQGDEDKQNNS